MGRETTLSKITPRPRTGTSLSSKSSIIALYAALSIVYIILMFALPTDKKTLVKYHISTTAIKVISSVIVLPIIAVWGVGFYGYYKYRLYADSIHNTKDGSNHQLIASGLFLLVLSLPATSILGNLLSYYGRLYSGFQPSSVIITNYLTVVLYLVAFAFIYKGTTGLLHITGKTLRPRSEAYLIVAYTLLVGAFAYISLHNPARQFPTSSTMTAAYYLPDWLIIITILIPYAVMWYLGIMSAYRLWLYRNRVKGKIYRQAFTQLAIGLGVVVAILMVLRYLSALTAVLDKLVLKYLLLIIYLLIFFIAVGYAFIASGAKRLMQIEEV